MGVRRFCGRTPVSGESGTVVFEPVTIITVTGGHTRTACFVEFH